MVYGGKFESQMTLERIGLTEDAAKRVYREAKSTKELDFHSQAMIDIIGIYVRDNYRGASVRDSMMRAGIASWLIDALLDPKFARIFAFMSPLHWLCWSLRCNWKSHSRMTGHKRDLTSAGSEDLTRFTTESKVWSKPLGKAPADHVVLWKPILADDRGYEDFCFLKPLVGPKGIDMESITTLQLGKDGVVWEEAIYFFAGYADAMCAAQMSRMRCPFSCLYMLQIWVPIEWLLKLRGVPGEERGVHTFQFSVVGAETKLETWPSPADRIRALDATSMLRVKFLGKNTATELAMQVQGKTFLNKVRDLREHDEELCKIDV